LFVSLLIFFLSSFTLIESFSSSSDSFLDTSVDFDSDSDYASNNFDSSAPSYIEQEQEQEQEQPARGGSHDFSNVGAALGLAAKNPKVEKRTKPRAAGGRGPSASSSSPTTNIKIRDGQGWKASKTDIGVNVGKDGKTTNTVQTNDPSTKVTSSAKEFVSPSGHLEREVDVKEVEDLGPVSGPPPTPEKGKGRKTKSPPKEKKQKFPPQPKKKQDPHPPRKSGGRTTRYHPTTPKGKKQIKEREHKRAGKKKKQDSKKKKHSPSKKKSVKKTSRKERKT